MLQKERKKKKAKMAVTGSSSGQPQFIASSGNRSFSNAPLIDNSDTDQIVVPDVSFFFNYSLFIFCELTLCCYNSLSMK